MRSMSFLAHLSAAPALALAGRSSRPPLTDLVSLLRHLVGDAALEAFLDALLARQRRRSAGHGRCDPSAASVCRPAQPEMISRLPLTVDPHALAQLRAEGSVCAVILGGGCG